MTRASALESLMSNYQEYDIGLLQKSYDKDKTGALIKRPVERYSYALMRASLNVFVQHGFADNLNSLAFDRDSFCSDVRNYLSQIWPCYLEEARESLPSAELAQTGELECKDWGPGGNNVIGAWHQLTFPEFEVNLLLQVSNKKGRLGAFEGLCFLENDHDASYELPQDHAITCHHMGSLHLQMITDEILEALGISPESAMSAIKWQVR